MHANGVVSGDPSPDPELQAWYRTALALNLASDGRVDWLCWVPCWVPYDNNERCTGLIERTVLGFTPKDKFCRCPCHVTLPEGLI